MAKEIKYIPAVCVIGNASYQERANILSWIWKQYVTVDNWHHCCGWTTSG